MSTNQVDNAAVVGASARDELRNFTDMVERMYDEENDGATQYFNYQVSRGSQATFQLATITSVNFRLEFHIVTEIHTASTSRSWN